VSQHKQLFLGGVSRFLLLGFLTLLVAACRPQAAAVLPTPIPTLTSVPRSTPLPSLPTSVPIGNADNPIHLIIHPSAKPDSDKIVTDLEAAIEKKTGWVVKIELVDSDAAALSALCASTADQPAVAWLTGLGYIAANAKKCGQPQLLVSHGTGTKATTGEVATIVVRRGISALSDIKGRIFCRISNTDLVSWLIPSMMMEAAGIDPENDPKTIKEYAEPADLVKAVAASTCDAAAIPDSLVGELVTDDNAVSAKASTLTSSVTFPYAVLVASSDIPLSVVTTLNDEWIALSKDRQLKANVSQLLGQSSFVPAKTEDLQPFLDFMATTKHDFAQLGS